MILDEIATYLAAQGIGTVGTDIFEGLEPDTPANCVTILEYPGQGGEYTFGTGNAQIEKPRIQVVVRNTTYPDARSKMQAVYKALDGLTETDLSDVRYHLVTALQPPYAMPIDKNMRYKIQCNFAIQKAISP